MSDHLKRVDLDDIRVAGSLDTDVTADGIVFRRLPAWTRAEIAEIQFHLMVTMSAGVRFELLTDARTIELDVLLTRLEMNGQPSKPAVFDLVVDGAVAASHESTAGNRILYDAFTQQVDFAFGDPTTVRFTDVVRGANGAPAFVEIWLPQDCVVEFRALRVSDGASVAVPESDRRRWIHYGSSISHCLEARRPTETWPAIAARLARVDLHNLAFAGECMLDQFVARTIRDLSADLISIKAGINIVNGDTMRERTFGPSLHGFLDTVRDGHPTTPIVLATPIICPSAEDHPGPTVLGRDGRFHIVPRSPELSTGALTLHRIRELTADVVAVRRDAGDPHLHVVNGLDLFGPDDAGDLYDDLHPTAEGYRRIGERFYALAFERPGPFASPPS
jgi:hypothetical protein